MIAKHSAYARVLLALGSNLGSREANLRAALTHLNARGLRVVRQSPIIESDPVGVIDQPAFLNMAAEIETDLAPLELLNAIQSIEQAVGRTPSYRWGPRILDIDIILWGDQIIRETRLQVPHPRFRERAFVLKPLAEIAPEAVDPETGQTVAALAGQLEQ